MPSGDEKPPKPEGKKEKRKGRKKKKRRDKENKINDTVFIRQTKVIAFFYVSVYTIL